MRITLPTCMVREWQRSDAESLARHANDPPHLAQPA
jgi:hypothetical protein